MAQAVNDDLELNLGDLPSGEFEALTPGTYPATIFGIPDLKKSVPDGNPYLNVTFKIRGGEYAGRQVWTRLSLLPQSLWKTKQTLERLGFKKLAESKTLKVGELREALGGKDCRITLSTRSYLPNGASDEKENYKTTNDVLEILGDSGGAAPASAKSGKDLF